MVHKEPDGIIFDNSVVLERQIVDQWPVNISDQSCCAQLRFRTVSPVK